MVFSKFAFTVSLIIKATSSGNDVCTSHSLSKVFPSGPVLRFTLKFPPTCKGMLNCKIILSVLPSIQFDVAPIMFTAYGPVIKKSPPPASILLHFIFFLKTSSSV